MGVVASPGKRCVCLGCRRKPDEARGVGIIRQKGLARNRVYASVKCLKNEGNVAKLRTSIWPRTAAMMAAPKRRRRATRIPNLTSERREDVGEEYSICGGLGLDGSWERGCHQ